jgi:hypothetical protein
MKCNIQQTLHTVNFWFFPHASSCLGNLAVTYKLRRLPHHYTARARVAQCIFVRFPRLYESHKGFFCC